MGKKLNVCLQNSIFKENDGVEINRGRVIVELPLINARKSLISTT